MLVFVDGIVYQYQSVGGVSRLFNEILPRMCDMDESLEIELLVSSECRQMLPIHSRIHLRTPSRFVRLYRLVRQSVGTIPWPHATTKELLGHAISQSRAIVGKAWRYGPGSAIWHSTYYTFPAKWDGAVVVTVHDMAYERLAHLFTGEPNDQFRERKRKCILSADAVICVSEATKSDVQSFYGIESSKLLVVPNGFSRTFRVLDKHSFSLTQREAKPFLLYVGSRARYKNFLALLQAYRNWPGTNTVDLFVVGGSPSEEEARNISEWGIGSRVHFLTKVDDDRLCLLYNQAVALVYPSLIEGFGIPLLEAMACGCPVVASRIPSTLEVAGPVPIYFEPTDTEELIAALDQVLAEGRNAKRVLQGLECVKRYSWEETARLTLQVYHGVVGRTF